MVNRCSVVAVLACAALAAGCAPSADSAEGTGPSAVVTPASSKTTEPSVAATPGPATTLGREERDLEAGTYRLDLTELAEGGDEFPPFLATVPDGWNSLDGWILNRPRSGEGIPPVAVQFWDVDEVYGHPCQWDGTLFQPGPTADGLVEGLINIPLRNALQPIDVTLDRYAGTYLEWSVPRDIEIDDGGNFPECDSTGDGHRDFRSWTGKGWAGVRYQQAPGQIDRLWILDIDGARLVIDAFSMPSATPEEIEELVAVVESIRFEP